MLSGGLFQKRQQAIPGAKFVKLGDLKKSINIGRLPASLEDKSADNRNFFQKMLVNTSKKSTTHRNKNKNLKYLLASDLVHSFIIKNSSFICSCNPIWWFMYSIRSFFTFSTLTVNSWKKNVFHLLYITGNVKRDCNNEI